MLGKARVLETRDRSLGRSFDCENKKKITMEKEEKNSEHGNQRACHNTI